MYCERCGKLIDDSRNYCNGCGVKLVKESDEAPKGMLDNILTTLCVVVVFGFGILVGLVAVLMSNGVEPKFVMFISIAYLAAIFGICYTLLSQVPKLIDARLDQKRDSPDLVPPVQLAAPTTAQLEEYRQPASVIDNTTRTLDEVSLRRS